jgi:exonuclease V gamma subunit
VEATSDDLPTGLVALEAWKVAERLLEAVLRGTSLDTWLRRERAVGSLPAGVLGDRDVATLTANVAKLVDAALERGFVAGAATICTVDVELDPVTRIVGTVRVDRAEPPGPVRITYSKFKPKHLVAPWIELMALVAHDPHTEHQAVVVNRAASGTKAHRLVLRPAGSDASERRERARTALGVAVECYRRALLEPIPLFSVLSKKVHDGTATVSDWDDHMGFADGHDLSNRLAYGEYGYHDLLAIPARPDDPPGEAGRRVARFATWFWGTFDETVVCSEDGEPVAVGAAGA